MVGIKIKLSPVKLKESHSNAVHLWCNLAAQKNNISFDEVVNVLENLWLFIGILCAYRKGRLDIVSDNS